MPDYSNEVDPTLGSSDEADSTHVDPGEESPGRSGNWYVLFFGVIMLTGLIGLAYVGSPPEAQPEGLPVPTLDLKPLLNSDEVFVQEDVIGKPTVFYFWGPKNESSLQQLKELSKAFEGIDQAPEQQLVLIACSPGPEYDLNALREQAEQALREIGLDLPVYADPAALSRGQLALMLPNGSLGYPTMFIADSSGTIVEAIEGPRPDIAERISTRMQRLVGEN